jgi:hypothetical protein
MQVSVKDMSISMELKNKGMELDVYDNQGNFLGDLVVTKTRLTWCPGKTKPENGHKIEWQDFINYMQSFPRG